MAVACVLTTGGLFAPGAAGVSRAAGAGAADRAASAVVGKTVRKSSAAPWYDGLYHNSWNAFYRSPFGAAPIGTHVTLRLVTPRGVTAADVELSDINNNFSATASVAMERVPDAVTARDLGAAKARTEAVWQAVIPTKYLAAPGVLYYQFMARQGRAVAYYGNNGNGYGGAGIASPQGDALVEYKITVYARSFVTPSWLVHGLIYEIFPDRFYNGIKKNDENPRTQKAIGTNANGQETLVPIQFHKNWYSTPYDPNIAANPGSKHYRQELALRGNGTWSTDYFGGDLRGVIDKLNYLQSLGVNTIYLTPIFQAESNHKYDTGNFFQIDPGFGTLQTYKDLISAAKARHMHVILDGVFEDTGSDSVYFNRFGTYKSVGAWQQHLNPKVKSPYYNWYLWNPGADPPYQGWAGVDTLPLANTANKGWQQFVYGKWDPAHPTNPATNSVARYWLSMGASGWRLDSADNSNFSVAWWTAFRKAVKQVDPQAAIIGEDWNNPTNDNGTDWLTGTTWDSTMNYPFRNAVISFFRGNYNDGSVQNYAMNAPQFGDTLMKMLEEYPKPAMYAMMNLLGSHDTERILTILEGAPNAPTLSAFEQATWRPTAAQQAAGVKKLELVTDFQYGFVGVPMIYYGDEAGLIGYKDPLSRGTYPWGRANQALIAHYRLLGQIRSAHPVLQAGTFTPLYANNETYVFARAIRGGRDALGAPAHNATAIVAVNNGPARTIRVALGGLLPDGTVLQDALNGGKTYTVQGGGVTLPLGAEQGMMLFPA